NRHGSISRSAKTFRRSRPNSSRGNGRAKSCRYPTGESRHCRPSLIRKGRFKSMGKSAEHRAKAESHLAFLATVADEFPDWLCTVAFYAAVEFVEEMLAARGHHSKSHFERKEALRKAFPK